LLLLLILFIFSDCCLVFVVSNCRQAHSVRFGDSMLVLNRKSTRFLPQQYSVVHMKHTLELPGLLMRDIVAADQHKKRPCVRVEIERVFEC
jgi:hypothetical protein